MSMLPAIFTRQVYTADLAISENRPYSRYTGYQATAEEETMSMQRIESGPRMSQAVIHNKTVYLAGQVAKTREARASRCRRTKYWPAIDRLLAQANTDKSALVERRRSG